MSSTKDILAVDDEPVVLTAISKTCTSERLKVDCVESAAEALKRMESQDYRLIISDIKMPEMDGFQLLAEVKKRGITSGVIISTGYATVENAVHALSEGAIDFIPKPFTADELLSALYRGLRYGTIVSSENKSGNILPYVPCPSRYYRLGYGSWVYPERDGTAKIGVTDLFVKAMENLTAIELTPMLSDIYQGNSCAQMRDARGLMHAVMCPLSGQVIQVNEELTEAPSQIEKDPFFEGWFYRIIPTDLEYELPKLVSCSSDRL